jgi:hypothetical protein
MQPVDITEELCPNIHLTLPRLDIQLQQQTAGESQVSPECKLDYFDLVLQGSRILHNASACHVMGQNFQLYPAMKGHSVSNTEYRDDVRVLHVDPVTHQEVQILQARSPPDVSKLESIAAMSRLFKYRDLDATLVVQATDRKHDDRYHFYWYFTIPTLTVILLTIMICNGYPYLLRNLLHKIRCTTQPAENSTPGNESRSSSEIPQNSNLVPVSYSPMRVEGSQSLSPTLYKQRLEAEISN